MDFFDRGDFLKEREELKAHPFILIDEGFDTFEEAASFVQEFQRSYASVMNAPIFIGLQASNSIKSSRMKSIYDAIQKNMVLSNDYVRWNLFSLMGKKYYELMSYLITVEEFEEGMSLMLKTYSKDRFFKEVWEFAYQAELAEYDMESGKFTLRTDLLEKDREKMKQISRLFETGEVTEKFPGLAIFIGKVLLNAIVLPINEGNLDSFKYLDTIFINIEHPSRIEIKDAIKLIGTFKDMLQYCDLLFSIYVINFIEYAIEVPREKINEPAEAQMVLKAIMDRVKRFRKFFQKSKKGETFFAGSAYLNLVTYYFETKLKEAVDDSKKALLDQEVRIMYLTFPDLEVNKFLDKYTLKPEEIIVENNLPLVEVEPVKQIVKINGEDVDFNNLEEFRAKLMSAIERTDLDIKSISERFKRGSIWNNQVVSVIKSLLECPDNFENIYPLVSGKKRIIALSEVNDKQSKGGDRAIIASIINDGFDIELCAIVFVLEFTDKDNQLEILIRHPNDIARPTALTEIYKAIEDEQKVIEDFPEDIFEFLKNNCVTNFDFDFENEKIEDFPYAVAFYIALLLDSKAPFSSLEDKHLSEQFLSLCYKNVRLKTAIINQLEKFVRTEIQFNFANTRTDYVAIKSKPRLIATRIFNYFARELSSSEQSYFAFTQEAKNIFEALGTPSKETASKAHIGYREHRIHFCYVNGKIEIAITWHEH